jgi:hypothetical protein
MSSRAPASRRGGGDHAYSKQKMLRAFRMLGGFLGFYCGRQAFKR